MPRLVRRRWEPNLDAPGPRGNRQGYSYDAFVPDPLARWRVPLPPELAQALGTAERAVAALNGSPPVVGSLEGIARRLLRAEAVASSRIEGLQLSHRRLARAEAAGEGSEDVTARAVLGNIAAMDQAIRLGASGVRVRSKELCALHRTLLVATSTPRGAGSLREEQNWIGGTGWGPRGAEFVPPPEAEVRPLLDDLCTFLSRTDLPPVLQAALAHAQFETIHPFADGNGRVGRALIHVVLRRRGLSPRYVPPVSLVLAASARTYVRGLTAFRAGDTFGWCAFFAGAVQRSVDRAGALAEELQALQLRWRERSGARAGSAAVRLLPHLPAHPVVDVAEVARLTGRSKQAANEAVKLLEEAGILRQTLVGRRRDRSWEAPELLALADGFEEELAGER